MLKGVAIVLKAKHCDGLQLFLYFDEVEICNPLGSKRKKHKLGKLILYIYMSYIHSTHHTLLILIGFFYFALGNLMPRYRSSLSAIQLLGIVKRSIMIEYGMNAILQPFINDIKKLVCEITSCTLLFCYGQSGGPTFLGTIHGVTIPFCCYARSLHGYAFHIQGSTKLVYGTVAAVSADNLGSNALGGFKESCSALRPCRQCLATQEEARCKVS